MTELERINGLVLDDVFTTILHLVANFELVPLGEPRYIFSDEEEEELSMYGRLTVHAVVKLPTLEEMEAKFLEWKAEQVAKEEARLAEIARRKDLKDRFKALVDMRHAFHTLHPTVSNPKAWLRDLLEMESHETAESFMVSLEANDIVKKAERDADDVKKAERKADRQEIKGYLQNIKDSDLPNWHKKILKVLVRDLKE